MSIALKSKTNIASCFGTHTTAIHIGSGAGGSTHSLSLRTLRSRTVQKTLVRPAHRRTPLVTGPLQASHTSATGPRQASRITAATVLAEQDSSDTTAATVLAEQDSSDITAAIALAEQGDSDNGVVNPEVPPRF